MLQHSFKITHLNHITCKQLIEQYHSNKLIVQNIFSTKYSTVALHGGANLPSKFKDVTHRCSKCMIERTRDTTSCRLNARKKHSRFARRLLSKEKLTKYQKMYMKRMKDSDENVLVLTCKICGNKGEKKLQKPKPKSKECITVEKRVKKKKRKDRHSGLNAHAVLGASKQSSKKPSTLIRTNEDNVEMNNQIVLSRSGNNNNIRPGKMAVKVDKVDIVRAKVLKKKEKKKAIEKNDKLSSFLNSKISAKSGLKQFLESMS